MMLCAERNESSVSPSHVCLTSTLSACSFAILRPLVLYCDAVGFVNANCYVATKVCCESDALAAALIFLVLHPDCLNFCFGYSLDSLSLATVLCPFTALQKYANTILLKPSKNYYFTWFSSGCNS